MRILSVAFSGAECAGIRKLTQVAGENRAEWGLTAAEVKVLDSLGAPKPDIPYKLDEREIELHAVFRLVSAVSGEEHRDAGLTEKQSDALDDLAVEMEDAFGFDPLIAHEMSQ